MPRPPQALRRRPSRCDGVSLHVREGETYGLLGPNGAGKTTTISMICGLLEADAGEVVVAGRALTTRSVDAKAAHRLRAAGARDLPGPQRAREPALLRAGSTACAAADARARVDEVLDVIGLADRADDQAKTYSGGMQRRLNIGIGLLHRPRAARPRRADRRRRPAEPQRDPRERRAARRPQGMAVLYTTHYMEEAERLCDRIGIIDLGELRAEGTRAELVALVGEHDRVRHRGDRRPRARGAGAARRSRGREPRASADGSLELIVDRRPHAAARAPARGGRRRRVASAASTSTSPTSRRSSCT